MSNFFNTDIEDKVFDISLGGPQENQPRKKDKKKKKPDLEIDTEAHEIGNKSMNYKMKRAQTTKNQNLNNTQRFQMANKLEESPSMEALNIIR